MNQLKHKGLVAPQYCPYCGGCQIVDSADWVAQSLDEQDTENKVELTEHKCFGVCDGRSFWV